MSDDIFARLAAPFPPERVSWRVGSVKRDGTAAMALAYIDARDVMDRFDEVCGPANWERRHPHVGGTTTCEIAVWIEGRGWVVKSDGAGDTAVEAEKGSLSDAFKRAAVNWGVGRYLYELDSPWVKIDANKKILPEEMGKLQALLRRKAPTAPKVETIPVRERGLFVACKAAIDLCDSRGALEQWAKSNEVSMKRIEADDPEIYHAVRQVYAERLRHFTGETKRAAA